MKKFFLLLCLFSGLSYATDPNLNQFLPEDRIKILKAINFVKENVANPEKIEFDTRYTSVNGNIVKITFYENKKEIVWDVLVFETENIEE